MIYVLVALAILGIALFVFGRAQNAAPSVPATPAPPAPPALPTAPPVAPPVAAPVAPPAAPAPTPTPAPFSPFGAPPVEAPHPIDIPMAGQPTPQPAPIPDAPPAPTPQPTPPSGVVMCQWRDDHGHQAIGTVGWNGQPSVCPADKVACFEIPSDKSVVYATRVPDTNENPIGIAFSLSPGDLEWYKSVPPSVARENGAGYEGYLFGDSFMLFGADSLRVPGQPLYVNYWFPRGPNSIVCDRN